MKKKNYISLGGLAKLNKEVEKLFKERAEVVRVVQWAVSNGDRSENADYLYGKRRMREIDIRLKHLKDRIERSHVVTYLENSNEKIFFGATVEVVVLNDKKHKKYILVGADEVNAEKGLISIESPIGRSLLGKVVGEVIEVNSPTGSFSIEILSIVYELWDHRLEDEY